MSDCVLILEDDPGRMAAMRRVLAELLPHAEVAIFNNAPDAIGFLFRQIEQVVLISLDHDLGGNVLRNGLWCDPGDGRDVCAHLIDCPPRCPVIVHSANYQMVPVMVEVLRESGWATTVVTPYSQLEHAWIAAEWRAEVEWLIQTGQVRTSGAGDASPGR